MQWYVVVDKEKARIYDSSSKQLTLLKVIPNQDIGYQSQSQSNSTTESEFESNVPKKEVSTRYLKTVSQYLSKNIEQVKSLRMRLFADNKLIEKLKSLFAKNDHKKIEWINKDLAKITESNWVEILNANDGIISKDKSM